MANNVAEDRIKRGTLLDVQGGSIGAAYAAGPQFIGGAAAEWSWWVTVTLNGATSVSLKLQNTYDGTRWADVAVFRNDLAQDLAEHTFTTDGTYLLTGQHRTTRCTDKVGPDANGNYGGLRWAHKAAGVVGTDTRIQIAGAAW